MTQDDIIRMAQEVGFVAYEEVDGEYRRIPAHSFHIRLERFAALVAEAERLRLSDKFMQMLKKEQGNHNYWGCAANKILEEPEHNQEKVTT
jgi:hypothetical protein